MGNNLKAYCLKRKIPYILFSPGKSKDVAAWLKKLSPDLLVIFSMSQLLKKNIISIPRLGVINLHPSYLPFYRGPNPDFWQYYDMDVNPGVTVHFVDEGEDTGDIIHQERIPVPLGIKSPERLDKLIGDAGVRLLTQSIREIDAGSAKPVRQPQASPTPRARNILPEEHRNLIDWENWPIERIWNLLRGTELWLNAIEQPSGLHRGQRWSVGGFELVKPPSAVELGSIYRDGRRRYVACKGGRIEISVRFSLRKMFLGLLKR